jgi:2Fe-2S ferredoxin
VYVKKGAASLSPQKEREEDILDKAFDVRASSRLGCQAKLGQQDVEVEITRESRAAYFDEHPDERPGEQAPGGPQAAAARTGSPSDQAAGPAS